MTPAGKRLASYCDTSALAKLYHIELGSAVVERIVTEQSGALFRVEAGPAGDAIGPCSEIERRLALSSRSPCDEAPISKRRAATPISGGPR